MPDLPLYIDPSNPELTQAFQQFSLETEHLELTYQALKDQFKSLQLNIQEAYPKLAGKVAELQFMTNYLEAILSHISQGILFVDLNGMITTFNLAAEKIFAMTSSQTLFHSFWEVFSDQLLGFSLKEALHTKQCPKITFTSWNNAAGEKIELEIEANFVELSARRYSAHYCEQASSASIQGILVLVRNITDLRHLQIQAQRANRFKDLGELAARIAHEIRNPLGGIKGFASLLQQDLCNQPELQRMATQIIEGTNNLSRFVSQILTYARPLQPQFESVDLVAFIQEILQLLQADQLLSNSISYQFITLLPHLWIPIDKQLFKSALLNLCVNGLQAMPSGGTLLITLAEIKGEIIISIHDTGKGINEEHLEQIFTPFFTTKEMGNGLGLSEVYKVIQVHQGTISVQSEKDIGTTFIIKIPLKIY